MEHQSFPLKRKQSAASRQEEPRARAPVQPVSHNRLPSSGGGSSSSSSSSQRRRRSLRLARPAPEATPRGALPAPGSRAPTPATSSSQGSQCSRSSIDGDGGNDGRADDFSVPLSQDDQVVWDAESNDTGAAKAFVMFGGGGGGSKPARGGGGGGGGLWPSPGGQRAAAAAGGGRRSASSGARPGVARASPVKSRGLLLDLWQQQSHGGESVPLQAGASSAQPAAERASIDGEPSRMDGVYNDLLFAVEGSDGSDGSELEATPTHSQKIARNKTMALQKRAAAQERAKQAAAGVAAPAPAAAAVAAAAAPQQAVSKFDFADDDADESFLADLARIEKAAVAKKAKLTQKPQRQQQKPKAKPQPKANQQQQQKAKPKQQQQQKPRAAVAAAAPPAPQEVEGPATSASQAMCDGDESWEALLMAEMDHVEQTQQLKQTQRRPSRSGVAAAQAPAPAPVSKYGSDRYSEFQYERCVVQEVKEHPMPDGGQFPAQIDVSMGSADRADTSDRKIHCTLTGMWTELKLVPGDIVNILCEGQLRADNSYEDVTLVVSDDDGLCVQHPDLLLTGTTVSTSFDCRRKTVLGQITGGSGGSVASIHGNLLHDLFEAVVMHPGIDDAKIQQVIDVLLGRYMDELYAIDHAEVDARKYMQESVPAIREWARNWQSQQGSRANGPRESEFALSVVKIEAAEENIWSSRLGLKGKIDLTVQASLAQGEAGMTPFELKTGKESYQGRISYDAQVRLYTLMLSERYALEINAGLLFYLKTGNMHIIEKTRQHTVQLIMQRNRIADSLYRIKHDQGAIAQFLPPLSESRGMSACERCWHQEACMVYSAATDEGSAEKADACNAGLGEIFTAQAGHLNAGQKEYFSKWIGMLQTEEQSIHTYAPDLWTLTSEQREQSNKCLGDLAVTSIEDDDSGAGPASQSFLVRFARRSKGADLALSNGVRTSDYVVLSAEQPGNATRPIQKLAVASGFVRFVDKTEICVSADHVTGTSLQLDPDAIWRIDKVELESTFGTSRSNLLRLIKAHDNTAGPKLLRELVIDLKRPEFMAADSPSARGPATMAARIAKQYSLNLDQQHAIDHVLRAKNYALILGMPGTGKTTTLAALVNALVQCGSSVLLVSYTHSAVDTVLSKLQAQGEHFVRLGRKTSVDPSLHEHTIDPRNPEGPSYKTLQRMVNAEVVATTCLSIKSGLFKRRHFDYCIVDEASQVTQPACLGAIQCADKFILVGDHHQLPPLVQSKPAAAAGMDESLFKRLSDAHGHAVHSLRSQYRMAASIMLLANELVYDGQMRCGSKAVSNQTLVLQPPAAGKSQAPAWLQHCLEEKRVVVFLDTDEIASAQEVHEGRAISNRVEAQLVARLCGSLLGRGVSPERIGVISPYRAQLRTIKAAIASDCTPDASSIDVFTVDKYQGRDKDCVIVSFVRSNAEKNIGVLLEDVRRINVAITRAKCKLILIGSASTLKGGGEKGADMKKLVELLETYSYNVSAAN